MNLDEPHLTNHKSETCPAIVSVHYRHAGRLNETPDVFTLLWHKSLGQRGFKMTQSQTDWPRTNKAPD